VRVQGTAKSLSLSLVVASKGDECIVNG